MKRRHQDERKETAMRTGARVFGVAVLALLLAVAQVATAGVVNQWSFEEGAGTTTADSVGGQTGTLTNMAPATDWVASAAPVALRSCTCPP